MRFIFFFRACLVNRLVSCAWLSSGALNVLREDYDCNRNRNRKLPTSKAPLKSQAQGTGLFTSAASNQRGFPKNSPWEAQVRLPEGERMRQIRGVFQKRPWE